MHTSIQLLLLLIALFNATTLAGENELDIQEKSGMLRKEVSPAAVFTSPIQDVAVASRRRLKGSKSSKSAKGSRKKAKSGKSSKSSKSGKVGDDTINSGCIKFGNYQSDGSRLGEIIASVVEEQDLSFYCQDDFEVAKEWFLNTENHPNPEPKMIFFMEVSLPFQLTSIYFYKQTQ